MRYDTAGRRKWGLEDPTTRRQQERPKINRFKKQNNNFARSSHLFLHFFAVYAQV